MSHFDAQAFQEREDLLNRMIKGRAAFVKLLHEAVAASHGTGSTPERARPDFTHPSMSKSRAQPSLFGPLQVLLRLGCGGLKVFRKVLGRKQGSS
jgi:hypothetical protein